MMMEVLKWLIAPRDIIDNGVVRQFQIPRGSRILCAQLQFNQLCIWTEAELGESRKEDVHIHIVGTGHQFQDGLEYVDTVQESGYVWHVYAKRYV